jgi:hypothetical protein
VFEVISGKLVVITRHRLSIRNVAAG